jgi:hypothetical protein
MQKSKYYKEHYGGSTSLYDYDKEYNSMCQGFDEPYPTIIPHQPRVIAIGDIHGDMELAIKFLKVGKLIEEVDNLDKEKKKEYLYKLEISRNSPSKLVLNEYDNDISNGVNQYNIVYRYYKINGVYYVKVNPTDNSVRLNSSNANIIGGANNIASNSRWFKWTGESTYVVQVGDQVDRCRPFGDETCKLEKTTLDDEDSDLEIMLFYDSLDKIAKFKGGRVFSLLGNHEIMNVQGDSRYVSYKGVRDHSPEPRSYDQGLNIREDAFKNVIAKKMACTRSTILIIGDYLFVHGGITLKMAYKYNSLDVNTIIRKYLHGSLQDNDDIGKLLNSSRFSPLWYRKLAYIEEDSNGVENNQCKTLLDPILKQINSKIVTDPIIKIKGMVIGHTPQFTVFNEGITKACNDRIIRVDIGASKAFDKFSTGVSKEAREAQVIEILTNNKNISSIKILI